MTKVWFCLECHDQAPWINDEAVACPSCESMILVREANRIRNLEYED